MDMHTQATQAFSLSPTLNGELCFVPVKSKKVTPLAQGCCGGLFWSVLVLLPVSEQGRYLHHHRGGGGAGGRQAGHLHGVSHGVRGVKIVLLTCPFDMSKFSLFILFF